MKTRRKSLLKPAVIALAGMAAVLVLLKGVSFLFPDLVGQVRELVGDYGLFGTFAVVLLGSTLVPFSVDVYFLASLQVFKDPFALAAVAIVASTLGGFINYFLAVFLSKRWVEKQVGKETVGEAQEWFNDWGGYAIMLFGALPLTAVFDPLTFIAGLGRMELRKFAFFLLASRLVHFAILWAFSSTLAK